MARLLGKSFLCSYYYKVRKICILFILSLLAFGLRAQEGEPFLLKGRLMDADSKEPVPLATVLLIDKGQGTSGDSKGQFKVPVQVGDHIKISSIGYQPVEFIVTEAFRESKDEELLLLMIPVVYELDSVVVIDLGEDFYLKRKKGEPIEIIGLPKPTDNPRDWSKPQVVVDGNGIGIFGLLNAFDKELQQKKKVKKLQAALDAEKKIDEQIKAKYNKAIVKEVTGIDDRVIDEFMEFCNFTDGEILKLSEYEITARLLNRYYAFLRR